MTSNPNTISQGSRFSPVTRSTPPNEPKDKLMAQDGEESVTEPDDDDVAPSTRTNSAKVDNKEQEKQNSDSESEPPTKKMKVAKKAQPVSSTDESGGDSDAPVVPTIRKRAPVRQPIKRGGKKW